MGCDGGIVTGGAVKISSYAELGGGAAPCGVRVRRRQLVRGWRKTMGVISKTFGVVFSL